MVTIQILEVAHEILITEVTTKNGKFTKVDFYINMFMLPTMILFHLVTGLLYAYIWKMGFRFINIIK